MASIRTAQNRAIRRNANFHAAQVVVKKGLNAAKGVFGDVIGQG
jgi:hypothetical protein